MQYLGVLIPCNLEEAYTMNHCPLIDRLDSDVQRWRSLPISMLGRVNIIKINILPRLMYLFQALPVSIPSNFLNNIEACSQTLVGMERPQESNGQFYTSPYQAGGVGLPHMKMYHWLAQLLSLQQWTADYPCTWRSIEFMHLIIP